MFRKVQLKFFSIILAILVGVFIAVLGSINLIMNYIMDHQSKEVLRQMAYGFEYDMASGEFYFHDVEKKPRKQPDPPQPPVTAEPATEAPPETEPEQTEPEVTVPETVPETEIPQTDPPPEEQPPEEQPPEEQPPVEQPPEEQPPVEQPPVEQPPVEQPPVEQPPVEQPPVEQPPQEQPTQGFDPWANPYMWWNPWWNPWMYQWPDPNAGQNGGQNGDWNQWQDPNAGGQGGGQNGDWNQWQDPNAGGQGGGQGGQGGWNNGGWNQGGWNGGMSQSSQLDGLFGSIIQLTDKSSEKSGQSGLNVKPDKEETTSAENMPTQANGNQSHQPPPKRYDKTEIFVLMADNKGIYLDTYNNEDFDAKTGQVYITEILDKGGQSGMANTYQYFTEKKPNGTLIALTDKSQTIDMLHKLNRITMIIGLISIILLSAASFFLSGLIVRPIKEAFDKQKQFVSDASHELKTPLTVIAANADVLEGEIGQNRWLNYIHSQVDRMSVLVNDLLSLTRLENNTSQFIVTEFDLSKAVTNTALPFETQAFEANKKFELNIEDNLYVTGSEMHIKQMTAIFIDNALKYSKDGGTVRVSLRRDGDKKILSVYNTGSGVREEEKDKIFERFYRSDSSRARSTGGYGLGLAIARSIIEKHKFKVYVDNAEGKSINFIITMP